MRYDNQLGDAKRGEVGRRNRKSGCTVRSCTNELPDYQESARYSFHTRPIQHVHSSASYQGTVLTQYSHLRTVLAACREHSRATQTRQLLRLRRSKQRFPSASTISFVLHGASYFWPSPASSCAEKLKPFLSRQANRWAPVAVASRPYQEHSVGEAMFPSST